MDDSVEYIRDLFEANKYHHLVVRGDQGECAGVISDRDLLKNISPFLGKPGERTADLSCLKRRAHQIMTRQLVAGSPEYIITSRNPCDARSPDFMPARRRRQQEMHRHRDPSRCGSMGCE